MKKFQRSSNVERNAVLRQAFLRCGEGETWTRMSLRTPVFETGTLPFGTPLQNYLLTLIFSLNYTLRRMGFLLTNSYMYIIM